MQMIGVNDVKKHPDNPRDGDVPAIMRSLERFGQMKPIVVQASTKFVVAGNHTLEAARRLHWAEVSAYIVDIDDTTARAYLLADNRTSDLAKNRSNDLFALLEKTLDLEGTGYTVDDVETLENEVGGNVIEGETGEATKVKAPELKPSRTGEPLKDIVLLMTVSMAREFGAQVATLQDRYGTRNIVDTIRRAVQEAYDDDRA
jgi:hypothetical protein